VDRSKSTGPRRRLGGISEAAALADVSPRTIRRWIASGLLPGYRMGPRLVKVDLDEVDDLARPIPTAAAPAAPAGPAA